MATPTPSSTKELQPKVVQRLVLRTLVLVLILLGIILGIRWWRDAKQDPGANQTADTSGWLTAIQYQSDGQEVVAIKPDLTIQRASGWNAGATDRDSVWQPAGNFVYFVSDRVGGTYQVFRWNPTLSDAQVRSIGNRGRSNPTFPMNPAPGSQEMLLTSGGYVMSFDPVTQNQTQVLPPVGREISMDSAEEGGGAQSQFSAMYGSIGTSFRIASYCGGDKYIVAVMKRDEGDVLVVQSLAVSNGNFSPPKPIAAGEHIDFDVNPANGHVVFAVNKFQFPTPDIPKEFVKNGKLIKPFEHYLADYDPVAGKQTLIYASKDDTNAVSNVQVNPDGQTLMVVAGPFKDDAVDHEALVSMPLAEGGANQGHVIVHAPVFEPTWDPTGKMIAYARHDSNGMRTIFTAQADGSSERSITGGTGNFGYPKFSPQSGSK